MTESFPITEFAMLFAGRTDAFGLVHGESVRNELGYDQWRDHLLTEHSSLGVYPMVEFDTAEQAEWQTAHASTLRHGGHGGRFYVRWGCSDIDLPDDIELALVLACNLQRVLNHMGIVSWIERSKSKGYHVWVFASDWVPAEVMRRAFLAAHQIAGVSATEVNPKQVTTAHLKGGLGNYVNLPYPRNHGAKRVVLDQTPNATYGIMALDNFVAAATAMRTPFETLYDAAKLYVPPEVKPHGPLVEPDADASVLSAALTGLAYKVWREGPLEGKDRSGTLARFCHLCAGSGISAGTCLVLLRDADRRWGKFADRADVEEQLMRLVDGAYR